MKKGKKYTEAAKLIDRTVAYEPAEAVALVKKAAKKKQARKRHRYDSLLKTLKLSAINAISAAVNLSR